MNKEVVFKALYDNPKDRATIYQRMSSICKKVSRNSNDRYICKFDTIGEKYSLEIMYVLQSN